MNELLEYQILFLMFGANALVYIAAFSAFVYFSYRRLRIKGYKPPRAVAIFLTALALGIGLTFLRKPQGPGRNSLFWFELYWFDFFWIPLLLSAAVMGILLAVLPQLRTRAFGPRQVSLPLVWMGRAPIVLGLVLTATAVVRLGRGMEGGWQLILTGLLLTVIVSPTAFFLIRRGRRAESLPVVEQVLANNPNSPVLYLRAFAQESRFFVIGPKSEYGANAKSWHAMQAAEDQNIGITFEEYMGDALSRGIGPFVALGSPEDYLPPEGALRTYADDSHWKGLFDRFAQQCACMVAEAGKSSNLRWEFKRIRQEDLQGKLFVFTPFSRSGYRFQWAFWNLLWFLKGLRPTRWHEFAKDMSELGYDIGFEDPGPGSIITFDRECRAMVLTTGARQPADFVEPIAAWIRAREKTGRHLHVSCLRCGKSVYLPPTVAEEADKSWCQACEMIPPPEVRFRQKLARIAGYTCWAYLLFPFLVGYVLVRSFAAGAGWRGRLLGWTIIGLLPLAIAAYNWATRKAWDGSPQDNIRAASWYREAAAMGNTNAMVNLGIMYRRGWGGLAADDCQAATWYRKAAERGNRTGMNNLGFLFENGLGGLPKNQVEAIAWYQKAASLGQAQAQEALKRCNSKVPRVPKTDRIDPVGDTNADL